jgi:hypothetical protein
MLATKKLHEKVYQPATLIFLPVSRFADYTEHYDRDHDFTGDLGFYLEEARHFGPPVLEQACGTGRARPTSRQAGKRSERFNLWGPGLSK